MKCRSLYDILGKRIYEEDGGSGVGVSVYGCAECCKIVSKFCRKYRATTRRP
jgi:hypothetical protein